MKTYFKMGLKLGLSVGLLLLIFLYVPPHKIVQRFSKLQSIQFMSYAIVMQILVIGTQGVSWKILFREEDEITVPKGIVGNLIVNFAGTLMPGRFSSRLAAPFIFKQLSSKVNLKRGISVAYVHTTLFLISFGLASLVGFVMLYFMTTVPYVLTLIVPISLFVGGGLVIGVIPFCQLESLKSIPGVNLFYNKIRNLESIENLTSLINDNLSEIKNLFSDVESILVAFLLLILSVSLLASARMSLLFLAYGITPHFFVLMVILPAAYSVNILPISFGGIGLAEGSAVAVLLLLDYEPELLAVVVFLDRFLEIYLTSLIGWGFFSWWSINTTDLN